MKTIVSVIVPFFHGNAFIPQLLHMLDNNAKNVFRGTGERIEVLFVNDSPEESINIEGNYIFEFRILNNLRNSGIHASRVNGLKNARGEYILFLDQDDQITDDCLISQICHIENADMVVGNGFEDQPDGKKHLIFKTAKEHACSINLNCHYYYNNLIRSPGQVLIRKTAIPEYWEKQILKNNGSDDAFLWILMLCNHCRAVINYDIVYQHVYTGQNASTNENAMLRSQTEVADKLNGIAAPSGIRAFRRRAEYYCSSGKMHKLRFLDVGISRKVYSILYLKG